MYSFTLTAVGNLAKEPEVSTKGDTTITKLVLVGNDYAGKDEHGQPREIATSMYFTAFDALGEAIAKHCRKGDQLVLEAQVRADNWTDKEGKKQYNYSYVVQGFRFGAPGRVKREEFDSRRDEKEISALETEI
jgi:single-strand DNA-binding protein